jgi:hypothetical protein
MVCSREARVQRHGPLVPEAERGPLPSDLKNEE